ncbi:MAG: Cof-type HAD-IIB family hydrolase [Treponema sp.]|jgi:Cof subfamily protein (haloacid dehalogenase superfamily)|nr:Cof-type HAD-IIB family hydrolase [Treponema sp.]
MKGVINNGTIKALAIDLDGTVLAPGAILTDRTIRAFKACMDRGLRLIICTGRSLASAEPYRRLIGNEGPLVCFNGALTVDMPSGEILGTFFTDRDIIEFCVDLAREAGVYFQVYFLDASGREIIMAERQSGETRLYLDHTGIPTQIADIKEALANLTPKGCLRGMFKGMFITHEAMMDRLRPQILERFGARVYVARTHPVFLEILAGRVNKARGLRIALDHLGLTAAETLALGDAENDLPMFDLAGFSAAPANAQETVRAAADQVFGPCEEDAAAAFLEELFGLEQ